MDLFKKMDKEADKAVKDVKSAGKKAVKGYSKIRAAYLKYKEDEPKRLAKQNKVLKQKIALEKQRATLRKLQSNTGLQSFGKGLGSMDLGLNPTQPKKKKKRRPRKVVYY